MTFNEVFSQTIAMLHQHGRVSYRALKRQFAIQDDYLADLTDAILFAHPQVMDAEGRGLVWAGASPAAAPATSPQTEAERQLYTMLLAVMALLQREQRVSYRTLPYVFGVDEACLHAVRDELRFRQLACEEGGQGLVWTGADAPPAVSASTLALSAVPPRPSPPPSEASPALDGVSSLSVDDGVASPPDAVPVLPLVGARQAPDAERRQLTVLFCDLVGSTMLSGQLDPEDLRAVVRAYQATAAGVIQRYEGHIAQYLGDGLLVYFGYPQAHEDDAQRAVHTGVDLVEALGGLNTHLEASYSVHLALRIGIHTGPVVVGDIGGGGRHEQLALGETPNIAARLEGLAAPNTVVISPVTARLVHQTFVLDDLGASALKGVAEPMAASRVLGRRTPSRHDDEATPDRTAFLVGRDEELGLLRRRWEQSKDGLGQVVLLSGAAGLGKSSLVAALRAQVGREGAARLTLRCSPYHTNSALSPVIAHLQQVLQFGAHRSPRHETGQAGAGPPDLSSAP